ncbi:MAG TPA: oxidoreductase, partial [Bacteroidia bacterium]
PEGEKWILEEQLNELVELSSQILEKENSFALLNLYSMGLSGSIGVNLFKSHFHTDAVWGESIVHCKSGINLPLCTWVRMSR